MVISLVLWITVRLGLEVPSVTSRIESQPHKYATSTMCVGPRAAPRGPAVKPELFLCPQGVNMCSHMNNKQGVAHTRIPSLCNQPRLPRTRLTHSSSLIYNTLTCSDIFWPWKQQQGDVRRAQPTSHCFSFHGSEVTITSRKHKEELIHPT